MRGYARKNCCGWYPRALFIGNVSQTIFDDLTASSRGAAAAEPSVINNYLNKGNLEEMISGGGSVVWKMIFLLFESETKGLAFT